MVLLLHLDMDSTFIMEESLLRKNINVMMVAPKAPGHTVRSEFTKGGEFLI